MVTTQAPPDLISLRDHRRNELIACATLVVAIRSAACVNADAVTPAVLLAYAIVYAVSGWKIFPLAAQDKVPMIRNPHPKGSVERATCKRECGLDGHGVLDATSDIAKIVYWWLRYPLAGIGLRIPEWVMVIDSDPHTEGHAEAAAKLAADHGPFPHTAMTLSGRRNGGVHRFYRRPLGKLSTKLLGPGFDLKLDSGYVVGPPSIHRDTGHPYIEIAAPIAELSDSLTKLVVVPPPADKPACDRAVRTASASARFLGGGGGTFDGESIADQYSATTSWADILEPHGWTCKGGDPDADGAEWLHPRATSNCSATVRHHCLFVYSTNTPFDTTAAGDACGYTPFAAYAVLNFNGDQSAAARSLRKAV
jgi:hypothetical protein